MWSDLRPEVLVGFLWGFWHLPVFVLNSGDTTGALDLSLFVLSIVFCLVVLPVVRVLMAWVHDRTESVLLSILMHASLTGGVALPRSGDGLRGVPAV